MSDKSRELDEKINEHVEKLLDRMKGGDSGSFSELLKFAARFHKYSFGNQLLIWTQCPQATYVASFKAWLKMGNPVRKGQKGIQIIVPYNGFRDVENRLTGQIERKPYLTFGQGYVFDISQTENPDLAPEQFAGLGSDKAHLVQAFVDAIQADGIQVFGTTEGYEGVSKGGKIEYRTDRDPNNIFGTLAHEWDHEIRRRDKEWWSKHSYGLGECYAEGSAFVVSLHYGVERTFSSDYILRWGNDVETFRNNMTEIMKDAKYMIERIEKPQEGKVAA